MVIAVARSGKVTLGRVLRFVTGTDEQPVLVFKMHPSIEFCENSLFFPTSNTYVYSLSLYVDLWLHLFPVKQSFFRHLMLPLGVHILEICSASKWLQIFLACSCFTCFILFNWSDPFTGWCDAIFKCLHQYHFLWRKFRANSKLKKLFRYSVPVNGFPQYTFSAKDKTITVCYVKHYTCFKI